VTPGLLPWIKNGDIMPSLRGSDHCPIYIDLHSEIQNADGHLVRLKDRMHNLAIPIPISSPERRPPPRLSTQHWDEYSGKQQLLSSFFAKGAKKPSAAASVPIPPTTEASDVINPSLLAACAEVKSQGVGPPAPAVVDVNQPEAILDCVDISDGLGTLSASQQSLSQSGSTLHKRKHEDGPPLAPTSNTIASDAYDAVIRKVKKPKAVAGSRLLGTKGKGPQIGQQKISSFFTLPKDDMAGPSESSSSIANDSIASPIEIPDEETDRQLALELSQQEHDRPLSTLSQRSQSLTSTSTTGGRATWADLFSKIEPPSCTAHGEPTKQFTVNKPGPNKGRAFFVCSR
jgi:AP endonuclease 2